MCIVIDTNTLPSVFKKESDNHAEFKPVLDWIINGKGKIIFGGTKYTNELKKYLNIFLQFKKAGKAVFISNEKVDADELFVSTQIVDTDFDDQHIVSLLRVSGCKLICSLDKKAYPFFRHKLFYSSATNRPRIYSNSSNISLLVDRHIADICKPCSSTTKLQLKIIHSNKIWNS